MPGPIFQSVGTAATKNVGTSAGNVVQLDGSAKLPALDGSALTNLPGGGGGDLVGPGSATDNAIVRFDGTTGKLAQNSGATIDDDGALALNNAASSATLTINGNATSGSHVMLRCVNYAAAHMFKVEEGGVFTGPLEVVGSIQIGGDIYRGSYAAFAIVNPILQWPSNSPDVDVRRLASGVLGLTASGTGGAVLQIGQVNSLGTPDGNSVRFGGKDVAGTAQAFAADEAGNEIQLTGNPVIRLKAFTVATLPAGTTGDIAYVTDALTPTFLVPISGSGPTPAPVFFNGTNWVGF